MQNQPPVVPGPGAAAPTAPKPRKKMTANTMLFIGMVVLGVIVIICAGVWLYLTTISSSDNGKTQLAAYNILEPKDTRPEIRTVKSTLGINVPYNSTLLSGFGFAGVITYSSSDLDEPRPYSTLRIRPIETSEATRNPITVSSPELRITSSLNKNFWNSFQEDDELKDLSKSDGLIKQAIDERTKDSKNITASSAEAVTLGEDIQYKKVTFTTKDENSAVPSVSREDCYITVQNDRPYVACINNIRPSNFASVPQLESVLASITYSAPDMEALEDDAKSKDENEALYDGKDDEEIQAPTGENTQTEEVDAEDSSSGSEQAKIPEYLSNSEDFKSVASAVPATVRVGTIYCANITLTLPDDSEGAHLTGACVDRSSTGFFVSRDGLVATVASKVKVTPTEAVQAYISNAPDTAETENRLNRILDYLQKSRIIMQSDADELIFGLQQRDRDAIAKINSLATLIATENITIDKEEYKYAVQLSDKPIVVNHAGSDSLAFAYSDTVYEAVLEGVEYDDIKTPTQIFKGETPGKDVALLKVEKESTYPTLQLAESSNLSNGAVVNVVGLPMYASGTLEGGQIWPTTLVRQGAAGQSFNVTAGQRIQSIDTPSHSGLSGAPALNSAGKVIGLATYNEANCPDNKCYASMHLRDPALLLSITKQRNITLQPVSVISDVWQRAVSEYVRGNYQAATDLFNESKQLYPQNYLAPQFAALSADQVGSETDTSGVNSLISILKVVILIALIILVVLVIMRLFMKVFTKPQYNTQYGQLANGQYIDAKQWSQGGGYVNPQPQAPAPAYVPTQNPNITNPDPGQAQPVQSTPPLATPAPPVTASPPVAQTPAVPVAPPQQAQDTSQLESSTTVPSSVPRATGYSTPAPESSQPPAMNSSVPQQQPSSPPDTPPPNR